MYAIIADCVDDEVQRSVWSSTRGDGADLTRSHNTEQPSLDISMLRLKLYSYWGLPLRRQQCRLIYGRRCG